MSRAVIMKQPSVARISSSYKKRKKRKIGRTQCEVDVQTVQVPRSPFGLKDLRSNGVTARPPNDYGRWLVMLMIEGTEGKKGLYVHVTA